MLQWQDFTKALFCIPVQTKTMPAEKVRRLSQNYYKNIGYINVEQNLDLQNVPANRMIKVFCYNILANDLVRDLSEKTKDRGKRISDAIISDRPHFAMLQEVDSIKDSMENIRLEETYNYLYEIRGKEKTDGCQTLYDKSRFALVQDKLILLDEEAQNFIEQFGQDNMERFSSRKLLHIMIFEDNQNENQHVCVCNTHFEWKPTLDDAKYLQMVMMLNIVTEYVTVFDEVNNNSNKTPIILAGDYNTRPETNTAHVINLHPPTEERHEAEFAEEHGEIFLKNQKIAYDLQNKENVAKYGFKNAYSFYKRAIENERSAETKELQEFYHSGNLVPTDENRKSLKSDINGFPEFTNYTAGFVDTIDHIFYSHHLNVLKLRKLPTIAEMKCEGILHCPNAVWPSDHLPIGTVFSYNGYQEPEFVIDE